MTGLSEGGICELGLLLQFSHWRGLGKTSRVYFALKKITCPIYCIRKGDKVANASEIFHVKKCNKHCFLFADFSWGQGHLPSL